jgi:RNA polymerase primary sigma factor
VLLRDIIDLDATYGGVREDATAVNAEEGEDGEEDADQAMRPRRTTLTPNPVMRLRTVTRQTAKTARKPKASLKAIATMTMMMTARPLSLAAMEAELRDGVMETLDAIAVDFDVFRRLQDKLVNPAPGRQAFLQKGPGDL